MTHVRFPVAGAAYHANDAVIAHRSSGAWMWMTIGDALREAAQQSPARPFIVADDGVLTFSETDTQSESIAASLLDAGIRPGDRALFQVGTVKELIPALFGCFKAGIIPVCTLPQYRDIEIGQIAALSMARAYVVQGDFSAAFDLPAFARRMMTQHAGLETLVTLRAAPRDGELSLSEMASRYTTGEARERTGRSSPLPGDIALFQLSGGSTGVPKIIPRMHAEYLGSAASWNARLNLCETDVSLWALPLIHNAGMLVMLIPALLQRRPLVIQSRFDIDEFLDAIGRHKVTFTGSIGPIAARIIDHPQIDQYDLSSLRSLFALSRADGVEDRITASCQQMYGITEGMLMACSPTDSRLARHSTMGRPAAIGDEVQLRNPDTQAEVPPGQAGELCFRGPHMLCGYFNAPEATRESFTSDGYFRTGDLMRRVEIDGQAHFVFEGRLKDNINRGGEKFGAEEVEFLMAKHPAVGDVRLVAMPDQFLGERPCAYIIVKSGHEIPTIAEIGEFLQRQGLAKFKLPERIEVVDEFPLTRVGKVDKTVLRNMIATRLKLEAEQRSSKVA